MAGRDKQRVSRCAKIILMLAPRRAALAAVPAGAATNERTRHAVDEGAGFGLVEGAGEPPHVRHASGAPAGKPAQPRLLRAPHRLHLADKASPARHEHLSDIRRGFGGFWRPQEAFGPHVVDQTVRAGNRSAPARCRVPGAGRGSASRS